MACPAPNSYYQAKQTGPDQILGIEIPTPLRPPMGLYDRILVHLARDVSDNPILPAT